jgi:mercuric ion transport protein
MNRVLRQAGAAGVASAGAGAALTAAAASACCVPVAGPLIIALFGAGGSVWAASLKPYSPYLLAGSLGLLGYAFWIAYRPRTACPAGGEVRAIVRAPLWSRVVLWFAAMIWLVALVLNLVLRSA